MTATEAISRGGGAKSAGELIAQPLLKKLSEAQGGVIVVVGDSTSDALGEWADLMTRALAARFPRVRVEWSIWEDAGSRYPAATVVQAGDGAHGTLRVWNCSVGSKETHYFLAPNFDAMIPSNQPDLVIINLGHNENTAGPEFWRDDLLALGEWITKTCPDAELSIITQNARTDGSAAFGAQRRHMTMRIVRMRGWGCIDTYRRFLRPDGTTKTELLIETLHPNEAGERAIWEEIREHMVFTDTAMIKGHQAQSSLLSGSLTALLNPEFREFAVPPTLTSWTARECVLSRDEVNRLGVNRWSVRAVSSAAATSYIEQSISEVAVLPFLGEWITFVAWILRPAGRNANVGRVHTRTTGGTSTISINSFATTQGQGGFIPVSVSGRVDRSAGTLVCRIYCENGVTNTGEVSINHCCLSRGLLPRELR